MSKETEKKNTDENSKIGDHTIVLKYGVSKSKLMKQRDKRKTDKTG